MLGAVGAYAANVTDAFVLGATSYAIYDFTNYALFDNYPLNVGLMDTLWGGVLYSFVFSGFQSYK